MKSLNNFLLGPFEITESKDFAKLSCDFNPIHIDVDYSRTTRYGRPIVHGVYVVMRVLERLIMEKIYIKSLDVNFRKPVFFNEVYRVEKDDIKKRIVVQKEQETLIEIGFSQEISVKRYENTRHVNKKAIPLPLDLEFDEILIGSKEFFVSDEAEMARNNFPALTMKYGSAVVLELASLSNIVGVFTPGLNSIFKRLNLEFEESKTLPHYDIKKIDKRIKQINIAVCGQYCKAEIEAFYLPRKVKSDSIKSIYEKNSLTLGIENIGKIRALVIGGSRGVGEYISKAILAFGGTCTLTYSQGEQEALALFNQFNDPNICKIINLHMSENLESFDKILGLKNFNLIFYMASPKILNDSESEPSNTYELIYYELFKKLIFEAKGVNFNGIVFYPSTIYAKYSDTIYEKYKKAKIKGEDFILDFNTRKYFQIHFERLPKLKTQQNLTLSDFDMHDMNDTIFPILINLSQKIK
jgi:hypothetical protein